MEHLVDALLIKCRVAKAHKETTYKEVKVTKTDSSMDKPMVSKSRCMSSESRKTRLKETFFSLFSFLISTKTIFICLLISNLSFKILN
jgi:hypothetical protein